MDPASLLRTPTVPLEISEGREKGKISTLVDGMSLTAFQGRTLAEVTGIWSNMLKKKNYVIWMGLAGALVPAGMRKIISYLIRRRMIDVLVSTGANLYHDCFEAIGGKHYLGSSSADDVQLRRHRIDRMYDVVADDKKYYAIDNWIDRGLSSCLVDNRPYSSREVLHFLGKLLDEHGHEKESILIDAFKSGVPIFCPAIGDSSLGFSIMFANREGRRIIVDHMKDAEEASKIDEQAARVGAVFLGGAVPRNFIQQAAVFAGYQAKHDKSLESAVQITMDLGESTLDEARKYTNSSKNTQMKICYAELTIALPMVVQTLADRFRNLTRDVPMFDFSHNGLKITNKQMAM